MNYFKFCSLMAFFLIFSCQENHSLPKLTEDSIWVCVNKQDNSFAKLLFELDAELQEKKYVSNFRDYENLYNRVSTDESFGQDFNKLNYEGHRDISVKGYLEICKTISKCVKSVYPDNIENDGICGIPGTLTDKIDEDKKYGKVKVIQLHFDGKRHRIPILYNVVVSLIQKKIISYRRREP